jgi:hypothetical protein
MLLERESAVPEMLRWEEVRDTIKIEKIDL